MRREKMCRRKIKCQHINNPWILDHGMMSWARYSYHLITVSYHSYHDSHVWCMEWSVSEHQIFLQQRHVNKIPARITSSEKWSIRPFTEVMLQYYESLLIKWPVLSFLHSAWLSVDWAGNIADNLQQTADSPVSYDQSKLGEIINQQMKRKYSETWTNQRLLWGPVSHCQLCRHQRNV